MDATEQQQHGRLRTLLLLSRTQEALHERFPEERNSAAGWSCLSPHSSIMRTLSACFFRRSSFVQPAFIEG